MPAATPPHPPLVAEHNRGLANEVRESAVSTPRPGRRSYQPPRVERAVRLDRVIQFGGSQQNDSGSGLGNQPPFMPSR
jgi:hypothetical protein